jgi:predicted small secreted protein
MRNPLPRRPFVSSYKRKGIVMKNTIKIASLGALGALATLLAACNTVDGVGKDVEAGGEVIQDTARDVEEDIND